MKPEPKLFWMAGAQL